jgi:uncharacterized protein YqgV (UPF0045/DUF77 family)
MEITVEISYYPLKDNYLAPVEHFIQELEENPGITVEPGTMSTLISGRYEDVMELLHRKLKLFMEKYPSVFALKISNACKA